MEKDWHSFRACKATLGNILPPLSTAAAFRKSSRWLIERAGLELTAACIIQERREPMKVTLRERLSSSPIWSSAKTTSPSVGLGELRGLIAVSYQHAVQGSPKGGEVPHPQPHLQPQYQLSLNNHICNSCYDTIGREDTLA